MNRQLSILLIAPYGPDRFQSINRFADCLMRELSPRLEIERLAPPAIFGRFAPNAAAAKWLGYLDKLLIFPALLRKRFAARPQMLVHLCDQSAAVYTPFLQDVPHLLTCNDLLAIRAARGEFPAHRPRATGRQLQRLILSGLRRARRVTCISEATRRDLLRLAGLPPERVDVTPMGLHNAFAPQAKPEAERLIQKFFPGGQARPFILHVGGNQWYKNRGGVLAIYSELLNATPKPPFLVLAGAPLAPALRQSAAALGGRVLLAENCSHEDLRALYSAAECLLFPSLAEGFGWPVIEAQACGCPVIISDRAPLNEIAGEQAVRIDPENPRSAAALLCDFLKEPAGQRQTRAGAGLANAARFSTASMIEDYLRLYGEIAASQPGPVPCPSPVARPA